MTGIATPADDLPDRVCMPLRFDPAALAADLAAFDDGDWTRHVVRQNYEGDWTALPLRAPFSERHKIRLIYPDPTARAFVATPLLARAPNIRAALRRFRCPLRSVRLMRLSPGSVIKRHEDSGLDPAGGMLRIHVPILAGPDVEFLLNDVPVPMIPGSAWYLRLSDPHSAANRGAGDRIHLVVDCWMNVWLQEMLRAAAYESRPRAPAGAAATMTQAMASMMRNLRSMRRR